MKKMMTALVACCLLGNAQGQAWQNVGNAFVGTINTLVSYTGKMYIGGNFARYNGSDASLLAFYDGTVITPFVSTAVTGSAINGLYVQTGTSAACYALGTYNIGTGTSAPANCTRWTGLTWGDASFKVTGAAYTMAYGVPASNIPLQMVGGAFTAGGLSYVAKRNTANTAWQAAGSGFNGAVYALEYYNGTIYAGGDFTMSGTTAINHIAKWNIASSKWEPVATGNTGINGRVRCLKSYNGSLYVGGDFTTANGAATKLLAVWSGTAWSKLGNADFTGASVRSIQVGNGAIVVGGVFTKVGTVVVKNAAYYKTAWLAMGSDLTQPVNALIYFNNNWYCGQEAANSTASTYLRKWNATAVVATEQIVAPEIAQFVTYPNPSSDRLTLRANENIVSVALYTLSGNLAASYTHLHDTQHILSVAELPAGIYIAQIRTDDGKVGSQKVVISH